MYLLNTQTLLLEFFQANIPPYAILSHTWGDEEVSFEDIHKPEEARKKAGFSKIQQCCTQAITDSFMYAWCDTCCIDKRSSAELSEAINSMFKWYEAAEVCYAFVCDIDRENAVAVSPPTLQTGGTWFTRGWTLQELLAPSDIVFYDKSWYEIGTRNSLAEEISRITGIDTDFLLGYRQIFEASVAQRMSWASIRSTTRPEDIAYSLLGIFNINMPLLYGEGGLNAFKRLQLQLLEASNEHTIFAWSGETRMDTVLAPSPWYFKNCQNIIPSTSVSNHGHSMTNHGLSIKLAFYRPQAHDVVSVEPAAGKRVPESLRKGAILVLALLNCQVSGNVNGDLIIGMHLLWDQNSDRYSRTNSEPRIGSQSVTVVDKATVNHADKKIHAVFRTLNIAAFTKIPDALGLDWTGPKSFTISQLPQNRPGYEIVGCRRDNYMFRTRYAVHDVLGRTIQVGDTTSRDCCALYFQRTRFGAFDRGLFAVIFGIKECRIWTYIALDVPRSALSTDRAIMSLVDTQAIQRDRATRKIWFPEAVHIVTVAIRKSRFHFTDFVIEIQVRLAAEERLFSVQKAPQIGREPDFLPEISSSVILTLLQDE
ncbi:HET-domain-containing protein [Lophium mytilinum]|uniref:HET-domain-containing protein n=1 Tax=Lophium mytilinum TaxID=390894 RepID=A0A6A6R0D8_9PEZI|nr:HET-domain-containing protein [Lophium mytilinum]